MLRPWNAPSKEINPTFEGSDFFPYFLANFKAPSFASVPELHKKALSAKDNLTNLSASLFICLYIYLLINKIK